MLSISKAKTGNIRGNKFLLGIILITEIALLTYATWRWGELHLDSDDSAEMILSELLSRSGEIVSKNWYYSTEIRVLNTQLIMGTLFHFFTDWHVVRTVGTGILLVILVESFLFLCKATQIGEELMCFTPLLIWPFSPVYQDIVLFGLYYIPHLCIIFLTLGLILNRKEERRKIRFGILLVLAFIAGLGGIRMLVICYTPLLFAAGLSKFPFVRTPHKKIKEYLSFSALAALACAFGYLINNKVLAKQYSFLSWGIHFVAPQKSRFLDVIKSTFSVLGAGVPRDASLASIARFMAFLLCIALLFMLIRLLCNWFYLEEETQILLSFFTFSFLITAFVAVFSTQPWSSRYMIMPCIGFTVVLAAYFKCFPLSFPFSRTICVFLIVTELLTGVVQYRTVIQTNKYQKIDAAYQFILDSGMEFGFGDWDASDMLTEISNGRIHLCKLIDFGTPQAWYWLMEKDFQKYARGKQVFLLLNNDRLTFHGNIGHVVGDWEKKDLKYLMTEQ